MKQSKMRVWKFILWCLMGTSAAIICAVVVIVSPVDRIKNSIALARMEEALLSLPLPPGAMIVSHKSVVGHLRGSGSNHCDYYLGIILRSQLSDDAIMQHYLGLKIQKPVVDMEEALDVSILPPPEKWNQSGPQGLWTPYSLHTLEAWDLSPSEFSGTKLYLISFYDRNPANSDWRCH